MITKNNAVFYQFYETKTLKKWLKKSEHLSEFEPPAGETINCYTKKQNSAHFATETRLNIDRIFNYMNIVKCFYIKTSQCFHITISAKCTEWYANTDYFILRLSFHYFTFHTITIVFETRPKVSETRE